MASSVFFSVCSTPHYYVVSDGDNFCHVYFTSETARDLVVTLAQFADELGGDALGVPPKGWSQDQWINELDRRYHNVADFYGLPELPV